MTGRRTITGPHADGPALAEHAVTRAEQLVAAIRDDTVHAVAEHTDTLTRTELVALVVALAALVPSDVDAAEALEWADVDAVRWSQATVDREAGRYLRGARDAVAALGMQQLDRRDGTTPARRRLHAAAAA